MRKAYQPMLATLVDAPFDDTRWVFETKFDGFRIVAVVVKGSVALYSRGGINITRRYPQVAKALAACKHDAVFDGELVALDRQGVSRFQLLQNALRAKATLRYYVFDLMFLDGRDLRQLPLLERKEKLEQIVPKSRLVAYSPHRAANGIACFAEARKNKEEGIMAKRAAGKYYSGKRTREWLKIKTGRRQEVVIVGYTKPHRSRKYFGSLVLAVRGSRGWEYVGKVGTGFTVALLKELYQKMTPLRAARPPFREKIAYAKEITWIRPKLVGETTFTEWTAGGEMRHPAFVGLREDKKAAEVVRELPT